MTNKRLTFKSFLMFLIFRSGCRTAIVTFPMNRFRMKLIMFQIWIRPKPECSLI